MSMHEYIELRLRLLGIAGYRVAPQESYDAVISNTAVHAEFGAILAILEEIASRKVDGYGPFRYDEIEPNWRWEIQSLYQDIERKFGRLKTMIRPEPATETQSNDILEILCDLSVYAARGIQIIVRLERILKEQKKETKK